MKPFLISPPFGTYLRYKYAEHVLGSYTWLPRAGRLKSPLYTALIILGILALPLPASAAAIKAPVVPQPAQAGDIVGLIVQGASGYLTFGHVFKTGAVQPADTLVAKSGSTTSPVQMDVKARHTDGSVRHAVLTFRASGTVPVMLAKGLVAVPVFQASQPSVSTTVGAETVSSSSTPTAALWLNGPLVREWRSEASAMGGKLKIRFDVRAYADGTTCADVIYDNSWMFTPGKSAVQYAVYIWQGGAQIYAHPNVSHHLYSMWHYDTCPKPNVQYDVPYLIATGAVPQYDLSLGADDASIAADMEYLATFAPLRTGLVTTYMPATGGRPDIGPLTRWSARWLVSQDARARQVVLAIGDVAGSVPWHMRDEATDQPVSKANYPNYWWDSRGPVMPANGWPSGSPWTVDTAHLPELTYIPYLLTGSRYRLDLLKYQAAYAAAAASVEYQWFDPAKTLIAPLADVWQTRSYAWGMRQVAMVAYIIPDTDPMQSYFGNLVAVTVKNAVEWFVTRNAAGEFGQIKGFLLAAGAPEAGSFAPWQEDFLASSYALVARMGMGQASADAAKYLSGYSANFLVGRFLSSTNGFSPFNGTPYWISGRKSDGSAISTWVEFQNYNVSKGQLSDNPTQLAEFNVGSYADHARMSAAAVYSATGLPAAKQAFDFVDGRMRTIANAQVAWQNDPTFFFAAVADLTPPATPKLPSVTLTAKPAIVASGKPVTLAWTSADATSCVGSGFSAPGTSGNVSVKPVRTKVYGVSCKGPEGTSPEATVKVIVSIPPTIPTQTTGHAGSQ